MPDRLIVSDIERTEVSKQDGATRYKYFVKRVTDWEQAWGLWKDGWVLVGDSKGHQIFPLWPAKEYAEACAVGEWSGAVPEEIGLEDLLEDLLPKLETKGMLPGVFLLPDGKGVTPPAKQLISDLSSEVARYQ